MTTLNRYGQMARDHWQQYRPRQTQTLAAQGQLMNSLLAAQTHMEIALSNLLGQWLRERPLPASPLERLQEMQMRILEAEEILLPQYILLPVDDADAP